MKKKDFEERGFGREAGKETSEIAGDMAFWGHLKQNKIKSKQKQNKNSPPKKQQVIGQQQQKQQQ